VSVLRLGSRGAVAMDRLPTVRFAIEVKQAIARIEHLLVTNEFSNLRDGDTKTLRNLLAYRKVGVEGQTEEL
jgi:hypothetical protein